MKTCPLSELEQESAVELMKKGAMYRYNVPDAESSVVSICEKEISEYTGHKYGECWSERHTHMHARASGLSVAVSTRLIPSFLHHFVAF